MKCKHCNHHVDPEKQDFCPECGKAIKQNAKTTKKSGGKRGLFLIIGLISIIITLSVLFFIAKEKFDPIHKIEAFQQAIEDKDIDKLQDILISNDPDLKLSKDKVQALIEYLDAQPEHLTTIIESLKRHADNDNASETNVFATIQLQKAGKKWLIFDDYQLTLIPGYIQISTKDHPVELYINDEQVGTSETDKGFNETYGPFVPGNYTIKGVFNADYLTSDAEEQLELFQLDNETAAAAIDLNLAELTVESKFADEAILYINGEKTDIKVTKGSQTIGPFPMNDTFELQLGTAYPWKEIKSDVVTSDQSVIQFKSKPLLNEEEEEEIMKVVNEVFSSYTEALTKKDSSLLSEHATDNLKKDLDKKLKEVKKSNPEYEGKLIRTQFKKRWFEDPVYDDKKQVYVFSPAVMLTYYEPKGNLGYIFEGDKKHEFLRARELKVIFDEDSDMWKVDSHKEEHFFVFDDDPSFELDKKKQ